jgi:arylsulfatase A-like enzyme
MDGAIQQILTRIDELGIADETLVIVNGDHGETLDEHDCYFDHHGLYEPTLTVPLIMRWPGKLPVGEFVPGYCQHIDLVPTILELIGADSEFDVEFDGQSLMPLINGEKVTNYSEFYIAECTWMKKQGWRTTEWKFFESLEPDFHNKPPVELYNLVADPLELNNLADSEPTIVEEMRRRMNAWLEKRMAETGKGNPIYNHEIGKDRKIGSIATAQKLQAKD